MSLVFIFCQLLKIDVFRLPIEAVKNACAFMVYEFGTWKQFTVSSIISHLISVAGAGENEITWNNWKLINLNLRRKSET